MIALSFFHKQNTNTMRDHFYRAGGADPQTASPRTTKRPRAVGEEDDGGDDVTPFKVFTSDVKIKKRMSDNGNEVIYTLTVHPKAESPVTSFGEESKLENIFPNFANSATIPNVPFMGPMDGTLTTPQPAIITKPKGILPGIEDLMYACGWLFYIKLDESQTQALHDSRSSGGGEGGGGEGGDAEGGGEGGGGANIVNTFSMDATNSDLLARLNAIQSYWPNTIHVGVKSIKEALSEKLSFLDPSKFKMRYDGYETPQPSKIHKIHKFTCVIVIDLWNYTLPPDAPMEERPVVIQIFWVRETEAVPNLHTKNYWTIIQPIKPGVMTARRILENPDETKKFEDIRFRIMSDHRHRPEQLQLRCFDLNAWNMNENIDLYLHPPLEFSL